MVFTDEDGYVYAACRDLVATDRFSDLLEGRLIILTEDADSEDGVLRDAVRRETWRMHLRMGSDVAVLALGTLFVINEGAATYSYRGRATTKSGRRSSKFVTLEETLYLYEDDDPHVKDIKTIDEMLLINWTYKPGTSPSGVPWDITAILDPIARSAALKAYLAK